MGGPDSLRRAWRRPAGACLRPCVRYQGHGSAVFSSALRSAYEASRVAPGSAGRGWSRSLCAGSLFLAGYIAGCILEVVASNVPSTRVGPRRAWPRIEGAPFSHCATGAAVLDLGTAESAFFDGVPARKPGLPADVWCVLCRLGRCSLKD